MESSFAKLSAGAAYDESRFANDMAPFSSKNEKKNFVGVQEINTQLTPFVPPPVQTPFAFFKPSTNRNDDVEAAATIEPNRQYKPIKPMSAKHRRNLLKRNDIHVTGKDISQPIEHFSALVRPPLSVPQYIVDNLFSRGLRIPTPIQMQAIPALLCGRDILACAPTGSGKTVAFVIPMLARLRSPSVTSGVRAVVVSPTMELAVQIEREVFFLMKGERWRLVQHGQTTKNKDIMITTPRRLVTMHREQLILLSSVEFLVFDEGDKLWDTTTDFLELVDEIVTACTCPNKVVALFSATLSQQVEKMARSVMSDDPVRIIVRGRTAANQDIEQRLIFVGNELGKITAIRNLIREGLKPPVLIFVQSVERTKELFDEINCAGLHCAVINAKMFAEERDMIVLNFRLGKLWVLITTELLARGLDFKNVGTVINFDFPVTPESYVHRIGRTGRAGQKGLAITFFTTDDRERLPPIATIVKQSGGHAEPWMLEIDVSRKRRRELRRTTPHRLAVSTKKRILIGEDRISS